MYRVALLQATMSALRAAVLHTTGGRALSKLLTAQDDPDSAGLNEEVMQ